VAVRSASLHHGLPHRELYDLVRAAGAPTRSGRGKSAPSEFASPAVRRSGRSRPKVRPNGCGRKHAQHSFPLQSWWELSCGDGRGRAGTQAHANAGACAARWPPLAHARSGPRTKRPGKKKRACGPTARERKISFCRCRCWRVEQRKAPARRGLFPAGCAATWKRLQRAGAFCRPEKARVWDAARPGVPPQ
jgi:hypothetical protein